MTAAEDNVTPLPPLLERIGQRIDAAWQRTRKGEAEWVEGSLELGQALAEGRDRFESDVAFGRWLSASGHGHLSHQSRAALIGFASDIPLARELLNMSRSRSYELIWRGVSGRFTSARKPKRGRPKGPPKPRQSKKRQTAPVKDEIIAQADKGLTSDQIGAGIGVDGRAVRHELEDERIRRETLAELLGEKATGHFTEKGRLTIDDAIRVHTTRINKQFDQRVRDEVRRQIEAANDAMRAENKRLRQENLTLNRIIGERGVFTKAQFRQMQMLCHPDSSASEKTKAELSQILIENEIRLVKPEKAQTPKVQ